MFSTNENDWRAISYTADKDGASVNIDVGGGLNVWVDIWFSDGEVMFDFNKYIFHKENEHDQHVKSFQEFVGYSQDGWLFGFLENIVTDFLFEQGVITYNNDGEYVFV